MHWDAILPALSETLLADEELVAALGGPYVYPAQSSRPIRVPSVEVLMTGDQDGETFNVISVQFDYWARGMSRAAAIEQRLRALHWDVHRLLDGIPCWCRYLDSTSLAYPADPGVLHRALQFQLEVILGKYATYTEES